MTNERHEKALEADASNEAKAFAEWLNAGPSIAKAAGCHVAIKVTTAKGTKLSLTNGE